MYTTAPNTFRWIASPPSPPRNQLTCKRCTSHELGEHSQSAFLLSFSLLSLMVTHNTNSKQQSNDGSCCGPCSSPHHTAPTNKPSLSLSLSHKHTHTHTLLRCLPISKRSSQHAIINHGTIRTGARAGRITGGGRGHETSIK